jgi:hypothetical protein
VNVALNACIVISEILPIGDAREASLVCLFFFSSVMSVPKGVESASLPAEDDAGSRSNFLDLPSLQIFHLQQNVLMTSNLLSTQRAQPSKQTATR